MSIARSFYAAAIAVAVVACASLTVYLVTGRDKPSVASKETLAIGVPADLPGVAVKERDVTFDGFGVDVATYVAGRLGVEGEDVTFRAVEPAEQAEALNDGTVDLVFGGHSIPPGDAREITFAGPYYVAHQDILVRRGDTAVKSVRDLRGRRLCRVPGSASASRVTDDLGVDATLVPAGSYRDCLRHLTGGRVDAVSTDDLVLAALAAAGDTDVTLAGAAFTDERYGVGLPEGDLEGCRAINRIITEMYQDGVAETLLSQRFGAVDFDMTTTVPRFEGCA